jgi:hypothetical protein
MRKLKFDYRTHPLIGKWHSGDAEYDNVVYHVIGLKSKLKVLGVDESDGEKFEISSVEFDETSLSFTSLMPSTDWVLTHKMYPKGKKAVVHEFTKIEILKKL